MRDHVKIGGKVFALYTPTPAEMGEAAARTDEREARQGWPDKCPIDGVVPTTGYYCNDLAQPYAEVCRRWRAYARMVAVLEAKIAEIEADPRFGYPPAKVQINAPLALEQVALKATHAIAVALLRKAREGA